MTQQALRELVELAEKATPGPWTKVGSAKRTLFTTAQGQQTVAPDKPFLPVEIVTCLRHAEQAQADCDFIAAARNSIPHLKALLGEQREAQEWHPEVCPITQRPFFMTIEHPEHGMVPTYGGPYDSYTIPERDDDGDWICERYDHDDGAWVEGYESTGLVVVKDSALAASPGPSELVEEMEKLEAEWRKRAAIIHSQDRDSSLRLEAEAFAGCADRLRALITRHRGKS